MARKNTVEDLEKSLETTSGGERQVCLLGLALEYERLGQPGKAVELYDQNMVWPLSEPVDGVGRGFNPYFLNVFNYARSLARVGREGEALHWYLNALRFDNPNPTVYREIQGIIEKQGSDMATYISSLPAKEAEIKGFLTLMHAVTGYPEEANESLESL